jgi:hypothetical protein
LVSWCYQQRKFILSCIYYKLYVVGHLSNQNASCPAVIYCKFSRSKYVLHGLYSGAKPNKICFSPPSHWLSHRLYIYRLCIPSAFKHTNLIKFWKKIRTDDLPYSLCTKRQKPSVALSTGSAHVRYFLHWSFWSDNFSPRMPGQMGLRWYVRWP